MLFTEIIISCEKWVELEIQLWIALEAKFKEINFKPPLAFGVLTDDVQTLSRRVMENI